MVKKNFRFIIIAVLLVYLSSCTSKPNYNQQKIINFISTPSSNSKYFSDSVFYDLKKNEVVFVSTIKMEDRSPAFERTLINLYQNKDKVRKSAKTNRSHLAPIMQELVKEKVSIRYITRTDKDIVLADNTFTPSEYSIPVTDEEIRERTIELIQRQSLSFQTRLPIIIEEGVYLIKTEFTERNYTYNYLIVVSDEILSCVRLTDVQEYSDNLVELLDKMFRENFPEIVKYYDSINFKTKVTILDERQNIICCSQKNSRSLYNLFASDSIKSTIEKSMKSAKK